MNETTIAKAVRTFKYSKNETITITLHAYQLGNNQHPHFSATAEIWSTRKNARHCKSCGCLHEEILKKWPQARPIVELHLSNADDGAPMHAEANGWYDFCGYAGGLGEDYHVGNWERNLPCEPPADKPWKNTEYRKPTRDECLDMLADHVRVSVVELKPICDDMLERGRAAAKEAGYEVRDGVIHLEAAINKYTRVLFREFINAQADRWAAEAKSGVELINRLAGIKS